MNTTNLYDPVSPELRRLLSEPPLTLAAAAVKLGATYKTVLSWTVRGKRGVRLEAYELLGGLRTSQGAIDRFTAAVTAQRGHLPPRTPSRAEREERAEAAMERMRQRQRQHQK